MNARELLKKEEQQIKIKSLIYTFLITLVLILLAWFWVIMRDTIPPKDENPYEVVGRVDFGNFTSGSQNKNTFSDPGVQETAPPQEPTQESTENIETTPQPSETSVNTSQNTSEETPQKQPQEEQIEEEGLFELGESNEGDNASGVGNEGRPDSPVLDPNGLYSFGNGENGLQGRVPLSLPAPEYNVNREAKITYEFVINPAGNVIKVRPVTYSTATELINAGKRAIYKWKFNRIHSDKNQTAKVTITFKLK